ncbi:hypothetical protein P5G65_32025 [Paenibacillus chondroitinus]|uniref:DUF559 domain-containing protein n=1 Tax=Paenibacillus chondroitinus TaxID=59842 RepID=A0ABU6DL87_9BACL|nr:MULTISPECIES: hypothetical protein [Paenibacillus]MCY9661379.1 endonuclease domain-containing protein [Paenibacillus anseongense]MEB4798544.1 hypothetical protein [Paenibacillus chondroitinus]
MFEFEQAHQKFLDDHLTQRIGERKGRLLRGHKYAEKLLLLNVWWPLFGNFDDLHPEYEVYDWNRKSQFLDFAFLPPHGRFGIECDGFQTHVKDMDREGFSYSLNRDTFLTGMGWKMIHFSFDDVKDRPEVCRMLLQLVVGPHLLRSAPPPSLSPDEKEVIQLAIRLGRPIRPKDLITQCGLNFRTARKRLQSLAAKDILRPIGGGTVVRQYELQPDAWRYLL